MKLIVKHFSLADILFLGVVFDLDKYVIPWEMCVLEGKSRLAFS
jgi:hypothetical protein